MTRILLLDASTRPVSPLLAGVAADLDIETDLARALRRAREEPWDLVVLPLDAEVGGRLFEHLTGGADAWVLLSGVTAGDAEGARLEVVPGPLDPEAFLDAIRRGLGARPAPPGAAPEPEGVMGFVTLDEAFRALLHDVARLADTEAALLLTGPSGVGKSRLARAVHERSARRAGPFVSANIEASSPGHDRLVGRRDRAGWLGLAPGGTLYLDEVAGLSWEEQAQLCDALKELRYRPADAPDWVPLTARVVASSSNDLDRDVSEGRFSAELFYQLKPAAFALRPLAERPHDVPLLAEHFLGRFRRRDGGRVEGLARGVAEALQENPWPGNVRELENVLRVAVLREEGDTLRLDSLPAEYRSGPPPTPPEGFPSLATLEREHIFRVLESQGGNVTRTAEILGISRVTLSRRLKSYRQGG